MSGPVIEAYLGGAWVDISHYVRYDGKVVISKGKADRSERVRPATLTLTLNNPSPYRFSGTVPGTLYYGQFVYAASLRVTVASDASPGRFFGRITGLTGHQDISGNVVTVEVVAKGVWGTIQDGKKPIKSALYRAIKKGTPLFWWSLESGDGRVSTTITSDVAGGPDLTAGPATAGSLSLGGVIGGQTTGPAGAAGAIDTSEGGRLFMANHVTAGSAADAWRAEFDVLFKTPSTDLLGTEVFQLSTGGSFGQLWRIFVGSNTVEIAGFDYATGAAQSATVTSSPDDGAWHHIRIDSAANGGGTDVRVNIDDTIQLSSTMATIPHTAPTSVEINGTGIADAFAGIAVWVGSNIPASETDVYKASIGYSGDTPPERLVRLCAEEGITLTVVGDTHDNMRMGPQLPGQLVDLLEDAVNAGQGIIDEDRDAFALTYRTKHYIYNQYQVLELDYSANDLSDSFDPVDDNFGLTNDVTFTRSGGVAQRVVIADGDPYHYTTEDPPTGRGVIDTPGSISAQTDKQERRHAGWRVHTGAWKEPRFPQVSLHLGRSNFTTDAALLAQVVALKAGDRFRVVNKPGWHLPGPTDLIQIGESERIDKFERKLTWNAVPYLPWEVWQLETGGSTIAAAAASGATSLKVATSLGPEWSTNVPYLINVNGEIVKVTAISTDTPAFIAAGTVAHAVNASVTPGMPAGITPDVGQSLFVWAAIRNSGTGTVDTPTGYTALATFGNTKLLHRYYVTGDTAPTITFTGGAASEDTSARMFAFSGLSKEIGSGTKATPAAATQLNGSTQDIATPALTIFRDGVLLYLGWKQDDWTSVATVSGATAEIMDNATTTGNDQGIVADYKTVTGTPTGPAGTTIAAGSFVVTGGAAGISRAILVSLRPLQTFTVTRSVNAVTQAITAGQAIHSIRQGALAL